MKIYSRHIIVVTREQTNNLSVTPGKMRSWSGVAEKKRWWGCAGGGTNTSGWLVEFVVF